DDEVARFVGNVYARIHRSEGAAVDRDVERFLATLATNEQARALGRTPLLLVMLLMVGRDAPLPDQRSELYRACLENLLDTRPRQRQAEGVLGGSAEWAPDKYVERRRAVAKLALFMQERHFAKTHHRSKNRQAVAVRVELERQLPEDWDPHQRTGFLRWLTFGAGVMNEHDDDTMSFAHLGFQEYLAAWQLDISHETTLERVRLVEMHGGSQLWWETLRLWAALIEVRDPNNLAAVAYVIMAALGSKQYESHFWWLGAVLADGLGATWFEAWLEGLPDRFGPTRESHARDVARAWAVSQQHDRRRRIASTLDSGAPGWTWLTWLRAKAWREHSGLPGELPRVTSPAQLGAFESLDGRLELSEANVARERIWRVAS
ncbi:MAG: hypothetical protein KC492_36460, partial [Myxococcales bacterium]|nr:hypothetical protein [Myxococcales bacterium]